MSNEEKKIILCRGIQASGKSSYALSWAQEDPEHRIRFNNDDVRNMMGQYWVPNRENVVKSLKDSFMMSAMMNQYDIIVDNMNLNPKEVDYYSQLIKSFFNNNYERIHKGELLPYKIEFKNFFIPVEECIRRDALRPHPIGEKVIKDTWKRYRSTIIHECNNNLFQQMHSQNKTLPHAIIVDIDNTLALNLSMRPFYGEGAAEKMRDDLPVDYILSIVNHYPGEILIVTGRDNGDDIKSATEDWLNKYLTKPYTLLMREKFDYGIGEVIKKRIFEKYIKDKYFVDFVLEDAQPIVEMYRSLGLNVLQPYNGGI